MKLKLFVFLISFISFYSNAQSSLPISSAEISFRFVSQDVEGTIAGFSSSSRIDLNDLENSQLKGSVAVETIDTGNSTRNWSLVRGKYFDAKAHPKITFESSAIQVNGNDITVVGMLTIKGVTKEVAIKFTKTEKQLIGKMTIFSSDFGVQVKTAREKNKVTVEIVLHL